MRNGSSIPFAQPDQRLDRFLQIPSYPFQHHGIPIVIVEAHVPQFGKLSLRVIPTRAVLLNTGPEYRGLAAPGRLPTLPISRAARFLVTGCLFALGTERKY
jgi:hypothetical protein